MSVLPRHDRRSTAVVIGAGIAGLLAARVLSEHVDRVIVLDHDALPEGTDPRGGAPQSAHPHALLSRGRAALEDLFPGLTAELLERGAVAGDPQADSRWVTDGYTMAPAPSGLMGVLVSRPLLERQVRRRTLADPRIQLHQRVDVRTLLHDADGRVLGVAAVEWDGAANGDRAADQGIRHWEAELVVDATGRMSRTPEWLVTLGFEPPQEERVEVDVAYSTRHYRREPGHLDGALGALVSASPTCPRGGVLLAQEGDRWICTLAGFFGDRPPVDPDGFEAYAGTLLSPLLQEVISSAVPLDDPRRFRFPASVRRRYERLARMPQGLLVVGDAICSFDPVYGQGMTVAALEAIALRRMLAGGLDRPGLAAEFWQAAATTIDNPWQIAVGGDMRLPGYRGPVDRRTRMVNAYLAKVHRAASLDPVVGTAFMRVAQMEAPPSSLMSPGVMAHVLSGSLRAPLSLDEFRVSA
jgi:2-polyprenyl-6-methoxyphenol hydroxylase-like FAD-dependent oxidoreductase